MSQKKITRDFINPQGRLIEVTADISLTQFIFVAECDAVGGAITVTLPRAVGIGGKEIFVKKVDSSTNAITIATVFNETIDGQAIQSLSNEGDAIHMVSDNENWLILSLGVGGAVSEVGLQFAYSPEIVNLTGTQLFDADFRGQAIGEGFRPGTGQLKAGSVKAIRARRFNAGAGTNRIQIHKNGVAQGTGLIISQGGTQQVFTSTEEVSFAIDDIIEIQVVGVLLSARVLVEFEYP